MVYYSVWCVVCGVWCMEYGVWCMVFMVYGVYGVWCMEYGVWSMVKWCIMVYYGVWCMDGSWALSTAGLQRLHSKLQQASYKMGGQDWERLFAAVDKDHSGYYIQL